MCVCNKCLKAIESKEGLQRRIAIATNPEDDHGSKCDWCGESGFDVLYSLIRSVDNDEEE